jgi:hypothetical protein
MGDHVHNDGQRERGELDDDPSTPMARRGGGSAYKQDETLHSQ